MTERIFLLDGGMGRELLRIGAPFRQPEWSALALLEAPDYVEQVHTSYIQAGSDFITTNSYALVPFHIGQERFDARAQELAALAGSLARQAADKATHPVRIAGSLPPLFGSYRPDLFEADKAQALITPLINGLSPYVDFWLAETLSSTEEATAVANALQGDTRERWFSFTLDDNNLADVAAIRAGTALPTLRSGESIAKAFDIAVKAGATGFLFNCTQAELMEAAIRHARALRDAAGKTDIKLGVYANSFVPVEQKGGANAEISQLRDDLDPAAYADFARHWQAAGASVIGGCCGIGPEHINALATAISPEATK